MKSSELRYEYRAYPLEETEVLRISFLNLGSLRGIWKTDRAIMDLTVQEAARRKDLRGKIEVRVRFCCAPAL